MSYGAYLKDLLAPLGVYDLEGTVNGGELECIGAALDGVEQELEDIEREMVLSTAEGMGLERIESLLARKPVAGTLEERRAALAAINDNLRGCGLNAVASETGESGRVEVRFPDVPGVPEGFEEMRAIIEDIIPCHLLVTYVYWYITWEQMEERFQTWGEIEEMDLTWGELEKLVR